LEECKNKGPVGNSSPDIIGSTTTMGDTDDDLEGIPPFVVATLLFCFERDAGRDDRNRAMGWSESSVNRLRDLFRLSEPDPGWAAKRSKRPRAGLFSSPGPAEQAMLAAC